MKTLDRSHLWHGTVLLIASLWPLAGAAATTNAVTASGISAYVINGNNNPTLTLWRGATYLFNVNAPSHPFYIKTVPDSTGTGNAHTNGVTGNGVTVGTLTFVVPTNAPNTLYYHCSIHAAMGGTLNIMNPPGPPVVRIVSLNVGANIVVRSTGTNGWGAVPEYACDGQGTNWMPVPSFTNTSANNTNTTSFDRLDPLCGSNVFLRIRNQLN